MNRYSYVRVLAVAVLGLSVFSSTVRAQDATLLSEVNESITVAELAVTEARVAIQEGKQQIALIPQDSPALGEVSEVLTIISENWAAAVDALNGAKASVAKIASVSNESVVGDYALLAKVNAGVALADASVVQIGLSYIDALVGDKTESLDIIHSAMQDAIASASQVQFNYERVKSLIAKKYTK